MLKQICLQWSSSRHICRHLRRDGTEGMMAEIREGSQVMLWGVVEVGEGKEWWEEGWEGGE